MSHYPPTTRRLQLASIRCLIPTIQRQGRAFGPPSQGPRRSDRRTAHRKGSRCSSGLFLKGRRVPKNIRCVLNGWWVVSAAVVPVTRFPNKVDKMLQFRAWLDVLLDDFERLGYVQVRAI